MKKKIIQAIYLALKNADSLYEEAQILKEHKKFSRAYSLLHLSFEECGRVSMLHSFFLEYVRGDKTVRDLNYGNLKKRGFERHDNKISDAFAGNLLMGIAKINQSEDLDKKKLLEEFTDSVTKLLNHGEELSRLKNASLYVSFHDNEFHSPENSIGFESFISMELLAKISLKSVHEIVEFVEAKGGFETLREVYLQELKNLKKE